MSSPPDRGRPRRLGSPPEKPPAPVLPPNHTPTSGLKLDQAIVERMLWLREQLIHSAGHPAAFYHLVGLDMAALNRELGPEGRRRTCLLVGGVAHHLNPADELSEEWDAIDFNVRLGEGMEFEREVDPETRRIGQLLSQKRADLIVTTLTQAAIIEVKIRLGPTAIGELLVYRHLWRRQDPLRRPVRMIGIAVRIASLIPGSAARADAP